MTPRVTPAHRRAGGFTLVEMLVALLVLSIGLLGVAAMQLTSLRANHGSSLRSQATLLAYDVADRMRANRDAALAGDYDIALAVMPAGGTVAGDDLLRWKQSLRDTLPAGDGSIQRVVAGGTTTFRITVQWNDSHAEQDGDGVDDIVGFVMETEI